MALQVRHLRPGLLLCHLLFWTDLFWTVSILEQGREAFISIPLFEALPTLPETFAKGLIFLMGMICLAGFARLLRGDSQQQFAAFCLPSLVVECYFVALDLRLMSRFWLLLSVVTILEVIWKKSSRICYLFLLGLSGPRPYFSLIILPLFVSPNERLRRGVAGLGILFFWFQAHLVKDMDLVLLALVLLPSANRSENTVEVGFPKALLVGLVSCLITIPFHDSGRDLEREIAFTQAGETYRFSVLREGGEAFVMRDGQRLEALWYAGDQLLLNPHFFTKHPEMIRYDFVFRSYRHQLSERVPGVEFDS